MEHARAVDQHHEQDLENEDRDVDRHLVPRTHQMVIEEFCQIGRLEIKFGRLEIIWYNLESGRRDEFDG